VFEVAGGFNEELAVAFNDIDFCLNILKAGFRNICLPHAQLYHYESKSRGCEDTPEKRIRFKQEVDFMRDRWGSMIENDPCYSPHLTLKYDDCRIRESPESEAQLELVQQLHEIRVELHETRVEVHRAQTEHHETRVELHETQQIKAAMETSKFWKLRSRWMRMKQALGMTADC
jgi:uncharacterized protein YchJ